MKELNTIYDQVSSYIKQDSLERALEFLNRFLSSRSDGLNEFCLSKLAQLKQIENDRLLGVIRYNDQYLVIKNNIVTSLLEWVKINIPIDAIWEDQDNNYDNNIKIDIEELRWRLNTFLDLNGIKPVYTFLKVLTSNISKKYAIDELEEFHNEYVWKLNNGDYSINDWEEKSISLIEKIQYFIKHLDEKDLILKWKTKFIDLTMGLKVNNVSPLFALFSRADLIKVPTQIIDLSEHQRFKRLMYLYQDAYQAGEYKIAYEYCIQLREEIEPESAQLYEYLMLSYFKLQNEEEIISKALDGQMTALNYLFVYASRLNQLQEKSITDKKKIPNSETGSHNLKQIASGLMVALATEYSRIDYDYIISNSPIENKDLEKIKKCIEIATRITQYIRTDILFAEIVINELSGGNKHQWISINEEGDPVDIEGIDALGIIKNAKKLIKYYNRSKDDQTDEILAENLLTSLRKKYLNLKKLSTNPDINLLELREKVFKCINSFRVGSMIFAEDKRFCDIPIKELSGIESILKWFSLSSTPDLITNEECESLQRVNPKEALEYFILKKHGTVYWEELKTNLMQIEYENLVESSTEVYNNIQAKYYIISKENIDDVIKVINCLEKMYICYCLYREEHFLDQILEELLGSKKFFWFELTRNGFFISKIIIESNNEIENLFNRCIESHSSMTFEEARKRLGKEYFEKVIKSKYEELKTLVEYRRNESVDLRLNVYALILQTSILYEQTDNQSKIYEKFIYSELVEERICSWFTIEDGVMVANKYCRSNNLKPEQILNLMIEINLGFNPEFIIQEVIENRYKGEKYTYQSEFHRAKNRNNLVEDRIRMVDLIDRFKMYFKITNDRKYLRIPYNELVLNKGRIRWYRELKIRFIKFYGNPLVFRFNHYQNSLISDFDFKRERFFFKKHYYPVKEVMLQNAMLQK